jgi:hypothetical protein
MAVTADISKMEYGNSSTDDSIIRSIYNNTPENALPANYIDANSRNCQESSHVDFLYLSTIRGGRKMRKGGGCGCNMNGGNSGDSGDNVNYDNIDLDDELEDDVVQQNGGCFTCKKGIKNITHIYSTVHIIIPTLYTKYKKELNNKEKIIKKPKGIKK